MRQWDEILLLYLSKGPAPITPPKTYRKLNKESDLAQHLGKKVNALHCDILKYGQYTYRTWMLLLIPNVLFFLLCYICLSGYMGCGLHNGRNGSPQNPFPGKGLYPCDCSSIRFCFGCHPVQFFCTWWLWAAYNHHSEKIMHGDDILPQTTLQHPSNKLLSSTFFRVLLRTLTPYCTHGQKANLINLTKV